MPPIKTPWYYLLWHYHRFFFFIFSHKFHPTSRAYFCKFHDIAPRWRHCCSLRALRMLWTSGLLESSSLSANVLKPANLIAAMQYIAKNDHTFKTQSLRVGGHTFYITFGLAQDFTNFLGRRAIAKASQLYYRANSRLTIWKLRSFFTNTALPPIFPRRGL